MGIKGLIDLVKDESMPVRLSTYRGKLPFFKFKSRFFIKELNKEI